MRCWRYLRTQQQMARRTMMRKMAAAAAMIASIAQGRSAVEAVHCTVEK